MVQHEIRVAPGQSAAEAAAEFGATFSLPLDAIRSITAALAQTQTTTGVGAADPRPGAAEAAAAPAARTAASTAGLAPAIEEFGGAGRLLGARVGTGSNTGGAQAGLGSAFTGGGVGGGGARVAPSSSWGSVSVSEDGMRLDAAPGSGAAAGAAAGAGAGAAARGITEEAAATSAPSSTLSKSGAVYLNLDVGLAPNDGAGDDRAAAGAGVGVDGANVGEADPEILALLQHVVIELDSDVGDQVCF